MSLREKLKMKVSLRQQIEAEKSAGGGKDLRYLNFYDLKNEQKMSVLIVPDANGALWSKYKLHGPNLKVAGKYIKGVGSISCAYHSSGVDCPACQQGFDYLNLEKETGDKAYREEAKRWIGRDTTIISVLVLESPIEIDESSDKNQVKLMRLPFKVEQMIQNHIAEGIIPEDELYSTPLVIKKTETKGGQASYETSYFERKTVGDDVLDAFDGEVVDLYDYGTLDAIPKATTTAEVAEWLDAAKVLYDKAIGATPDDEQQKPATSETTKQSVQERLAAGRAKAEESVPQKDDAAPDEVEEESNEKEEAHTAEEEETPAETPAETKNATSDLRDRLARLKRK